MVSTRRTERYRVLVTGASGFLGRGIVRQLAKDHPEWTITGLDLRLPPDDVAGILEHFFQVDITSEQQVQQAFVKALLPDIVLHTAGIVPARQLRYSKNSSDWARVKKINYDGTINVLMAALEAGCMKFVYTSSVTAVIDDLEHDYFGMMEESTPIGLAQLHYGKAKGMSEEFVLAKTHAEQGMKACVLRPCTIIGPEDTQVISVLYDLIPKGETFFVLGDGNNMYDWMYIDNAVQAHVLAAENLLTIGTAAGHAIFITNHEPNYFWDFLAFVWAQFDHYPPFRLYIPAWLAFAVAWLLELLTWLTGAEPTLDTNSVKDGIRTHFSNNDKSIELLGYRPKVGLSDGVRRACAGYKEQMRQKGIKF